MPQERRRSYAMWAAIIGQVVTMLILTNVIPMEQIEIIKGVGIALLQILSLFGIVNSPTTKGAL